MKDLSPQDPVFCPSRLDTGIVVSLVTKDSGKFLEIRMDTSGICEEIPVEKAKRFRWNGRFVDGDFLVIIRVFLRPFSKRHFHIQWHRIRKDGSVSPRLEQIRRINGRVRFYLW